MTFQAKSLEEFLADAADRSPGDHVEITVRELISYWRYTTRNYDALAEVDAALASVGLTTDPSLEDAGARQLVRLVPVSETGEPQTLDARTAETGTADEEAPVQISLCVKDLPSATTGVVGVDLDDSLTHAETLMLSNAYSQLVVIQDGQLRGAITWESISAARARGESELRATLDARPEVVHPDDDLLKQAGRIWSAGFALVANDQHQPIGIVTTADLADQFVNLANPFVLTSEIERRLRRVISRVCTLEEMKAKSRYSHKTHGVDDLMFGDYQKIFKDPDIWRHCDWRIDQSVFVAKLDEVREIRNEIMHFRPEPLSDNKITSLRSFLNFLSWLDRTS